MVINNAVVADYYRFNHHYSSYEINKGLRIARQLLLDLNEMGLPVGCEFLDTVSILTFLV